MKWIQKYFFPGLCLLTVFVAYLALEVTFRHYSFWPCIEYASFQKDESTLDNYYSALNLFVAIIGFLAVVWTIRAQQASEMHKRTEDHFFQLLGIWHTEKSSVRFGDAVGTDAFLKAEHCFFYGSLRWDRDSSESSRSRKSVQEIQKLYRSFYEEKIGAPIAHVLRMVEQMILLVDGDHSIVDSDKRRLVQILASSLSDPELHLLLYFGLSDFSQHKCKSLIDKYGVLNPLILKDTKLIPAEICEYELTMNRMPNSVRQSFLEELKESSNLNSGSGKS